MDTLRVDIAYRPLRIGWVIASGDFAAFRRAVQLSNTLWGGRFNPVLIAEREADAQRLVRAFRLDVLITVGDSESVKGVPKKFPHLINPLFHESVVINGSNGVGRAQLLDVQNALLHLRDRGGRDPLLEKEFRLYTWSADDPLADVFLMQFGAYPPVSEVGIDYQKLLIEAVTAKECSLDQNAAICREVIEHPSIAYLSRHALERHHSSIRSDRNPPGFYVGSVSDLEDLVAHWNLRAADIPLFFVDLAYRERYLELIPAWEEEMRQSVAHLHEWDRGIGIWTRQTDLEGTQKALGDLSLTICPVSDDSWNVVAPVMSFDPISVLGVVSKDRAQTRLSFSLSSKPFCGDSWFRTQHLVASVSLLGGLYGNEEQTLEPPFIPELNEFYARTMYGQYNALRIEPSGLGLVINATDVDAWLDALPVTDLFQRVFELGGYSAKLSSGGLMGRQLISQLNGLQGARVFKIPGVRRLLRTHGPSASFTRRGALQLIGGKDPQNPDAKFTDHSDLHIEQRARGSVLTPDAVFGYLVERGIFRLGTELLCSVCRMRSWISLDSLKQRVTCELCGHVYEATRQLVSSEWHYRRSGIFGAERHAQGVVPVALTLQQLDVTFGHRDSLYSFSLDLTTIGQLRHKCEVDFVWFELPLEFRLPIGFG